MIKHFIPPAILYFISAIWVIYLLDTLLFGINLVLYFGIKPRILEGLFGIISFSFLHANFFHIVSNTLPLLILGSLLSSVYNTERLIMIMTLGAIGSGLAAWIFGTGGVVIGASGIVYALIGYMLANAYYNPSVKAWGTAAIVFILYGGACLSLFTYFPGISWSAHAGGFVAGILCANQILEKEPATEASQF